MFINEVENIVGLSKKSIRLYEEAGLIKPKRNKVNDYRIYTDEDIKRLKLIKFLRELDVPIKELQKLNEKQISLKECMEDRIKKIEREEDKFGRIKEMCNNIIKTQVEYNTIDITEYFQSVRILNKEGFTMRDVRTKKRSKIMGAIISSLFFILFFIIFMSIITYYQFTYKESMPWIIYFLLMFLLSSPLISVIYNLVIRVKEIKGGEEDEASKY